MRKYELLKNDIIEVDGQKLYRIRALRTFGHVVEGDEGGYIATEDNLSHTGKAWVGEKAKIYDTARVLDNAHVAWAASVYGAATIMGDAKVGGFSRIYDSATVSGRAQVRGESHVFGSASVAGDAHVALSSRVYGSACVEGHARVLGAQVYQHAIVSGSAIIRGSVTVRGHANIHGNAEIRRADAYEPVLTCTDDWVAFTNVGSENGTLTVYRASSSILLCTRGCFTGTVDDFLHAVRMEHGASVIAQEYELLIQMAKLRLNRPKPADSPAIEGSADLNPLATPAIEDWEEA